MPERRTAKVEIRANLASLVANFEDGKAIGEAATRGVDSARRYITGVFDPIDFETITLNDVRGLVVAGNECGSLPELLVRFPFIQYFMQTETNLYRIARRFIEDCAHDGIVYVEPRVAPAIYTRKGLSYEQIFRAVAEGLQQGEREFGVKSRIIMTVDRHNPEEAKEALARAGEFTRYGVVAVDVAGAERGYPVKDYWEQLRALIGSDLEVTIHAGEDFGPESIRQAIKYGDAARVGHALTLINDPQLMEYFLRRRIGIEVCLSSNLQTNPNLKLEEHPVIYYAKRGARWFLNTDNRTICNTTLTDEYLMAARAFGWGTIRFTHGILNGFKSAFLPFDERRALHQIAVRQILDLQREYKVIEPA